MVHMDGLIWTKRTVNDSNLGYYWCFLKINFKTWNARCIARMFELKGFGAKSGNSWISPTWLFTVAEHVRIYN